MSMTHSKGPTKTKAARMLEHPKAAPKHNSQNTDGITGTLPATACTACREPAGPMHGAIIWRLCPNCRALLADPGAQAVVRARVVATLDAQRRTARRGR